MWSSAPGAEYGLLRWRVTRHTVAQAPIRIAVAGGGFTSANIGAFVRAAPVAQVQMRQVAMTVTNNAARGDVALVIGGSRGPAELTAKLGAQPVARCSSHTFKARLPPSASRGKSLLGEESAARCNSTRARRRARSRHCARGTSGRHTVKRYAWPFEGFVMNTARLIRKGHLSFEEPVLDFGCGQGRHAIFFARNGFTSVHAVDISDNVICLTRAWVEREGLAITYQSFDGAHLPYPDATFQLACCFGTFHHVPRNQHSSLAAEVSRVIKPGGYLLWGEQSARTTRRRAGRRVGTHTIIIEEEGNPEYGMERHYFTLAECRLIFSGFAFQVGACENLDGDGLDDASAYWKLLGVKRK